MGNKAKALGLAALTGLGVATTSCEEEIYVPYEPQNPGEVPFDPVMDTVYVAMNGGTTPVTSDTKPSDHATTFGKWGAYYGDPATVPGVVGTLNSFNYGTAVEPAYYQNPSQLPKSFARLNLTSYNPNNSYEVAHLKQAMDNAGIPEAQRFLKDPSGNVITINNRLALNLENTAVFNAVKTYALNALSQGWKGIQVDGANEATLIQTTAANGINADYLTKVANLFTDVKAGVDAAPGNKLAVCGSLMASTNGLIQQIAPHYENFVIDVTVWPLANSDQPWYKAQMAKIMQAANSGVNFKMNVVLPQSVDITTETKQAIADYFNPCLQVTSETWDPAHPNLVRILASNIDAHATHNFYLATDLAANGPGNPVTLRMHVGEDVKGDPKAVHYNDLINKLPDTQVSDLTHEHVLEQSKGKGK